MKISELVKELNKFKKTHGDVRVLVDLKNIAENGDHGEYSHEEDIRLKTVRLKWYNADTGKLSKKKETVISLTICDDLEE